MSVLSGERIQLTGILVASCFTVYSKIWVSELLRKCLKGEAGIQAVEEAPSSGNFWSQVPSSSNIQSSQSSVLDGLPSASLPIDQLQLKAGSFPRLSAPQPTSALSAPQFWGSSSVDSSIQLPVGAVGIQAGAYGIQGSPQMPQVAPLQMPWLAPWPSQSVPVTVAEPTPLGKEGTVLEPTLKRGRDQQENGMPIDSMQPSKRLAVDKPEAEDTMKLVKGVAPEPNSQREVDGVKEHSQAGDRNDSLANDSPNTSSHSSSPEAGSLRAADPAKSKV